MKNVLFLGSKSPSRQLLLKEAGIKFVLVDQDADEAACNWALPLVQVVQGIAKHKMSHVVLPALKEGSICFVLTADTLCQQADGKIEGKPVDKNDAIKKIKAARIGSTVATAFCLEKKVFQDGSWQTLETICKTVTSDYVFNVPDEFLDIYLKESFGLNTAGAIAVEGFGGQFLQSVSGSYSNIIGLPLFELRKALYQMGFFN